MKPPWSKPLILLMTKFVWFLLLALHLRASNLPTNGQGAYNPNVPIQPGVPIDQRGVQGMFPGGNNFQPQHPGNNFMQPQPGHIVPQFNGVPNSQPGMQAPRQIHQQIQEQFQLLTQVVQQHGRNFPPQNQHMPPFNHQQQQTALLNQQRASSMNPHQMPSMNQQQMPPLNGQQIGPINQQQMAPMSQPQIGPQQMGPLNQQQMGLVNRQQMAPISQQKTGYMNQQQMGHMNQPQMNPLFQQQMNPLNQQQMVPMNQQPMSNMNQQQMNNPMVQQPMGPMNQQQIGPMQQLGSMGQQQMAPMNHQNQMASMHQQQIANHQQTMGQQQMGPMNQQQMGLMNQQQIFPVNQPPTIQSPPQSDPNAQLIGAVLGMVDMMSNLVATLSTQSSQQQDGNTAQQEQALMIRQQIQQISQTVRAVLPGHQMQAQVVPQQMQINQSSIPNQTVVQQNAPQINAVQSTGMPSANLPLQLPQLQDQNLQSKPNTVEEKLQKLPNIFIDMSHDEPNDDNMHDQIQSQIEENRRLQKDLDQNRSDLTGRNANGLGFQMEQASQLSTQGAHKENEQQHQTVSKEPIRLAGSTSQIQPAAKDLLYEAIKNQSSSSGNTASVSSKEVPLLKKSGNAPTQPELAAPPKKPQNVLQLKKRPVSEVDRAEIQAMNDHALSQIGSRIRIVLPPKSTDANSTVQRKEPSKTSSVPIETSAQQVTAPKLPEISPSLAAPSKEITITPVVDSSISGEQKSKESADTPNRLCITLTSTSEDEESSTSSVSAKRPYGGIRKNEIPGLMEDAEKLTRGLSVFRSSKEKAADQIHAVTMRPKDKKRRASQELQDKLAKKQKREVEKAAEKLAKKQKRDAKRKAIEETEMSKEKEPKVTIPKGQVLRRKPRPVQAESQVQEQPAISLQDLCTHAVLVSDLDSLLPHDEPMLPELKATMQHESLAQDLDSILQDIQTEDKKEEIVLSKASHHVSLTQALFSILGDDDVEGGEIEDEQEEGKGTQTRPNVIMQHDLLAQDLDSILQDIQTDDKKEETVLSKASHHASLTQDLFSILGDDVEGGEIEDDQEEGRGKIYCNSSSHSSLVSDLDSLLDEGDIVMEKTPSKPDHSSLVSDLDSLLEFETAELDGTDRPNNSDHASLVNDLDDILGFGIPEPVVNQENVQEREDQKRKRDLLDEGKLFEKRQKR